MSDTVNKLDSQTDCCGCQGIADSYTPTHLQFLTAAFPPGNIQNRYLQNQNDMEEGAAPKSHLTRQEQHSQMGFFFKVAQFPE